MWGTTPTSNINNIKASTQLLDPADRNLTQEEKISQIPQNKAAKLQAANHGSLPSRTPRQRLGTEAEDITSFKHINVHSINSHYSLVEFSNAMGILEK